MDESQTLVLDTLQRLLTDWQAGCGHAPNPDETADFWRTIGETGLLGALAPESDGGLGDDAAFVFEFLRAWGMAAAPGPVLASLVAGAALLAGSARANLMDGIAQGTVHLAVPSTLAAVGAFPATPADAPAGSVALPAIPFLRDGGFATHALLPATIDGEAVVLCVEIGKLPLSAPFRLIDGATAATLTAPGIAVDDADILLRGAAAEAAWLRVTERMTAAACAEAAGLLRAMLEQTVAYVRQRRQFGQAIGSFQAIQHRLADVLVNVEQAHSLALAAIVAIMENEASAPVLVSAAKARVNQSIQYVSDQAVQLHGGIGTTQELALNRYFRRAMALAREFGTASQHLARVEASLAERTQSLRTAA